MSDRSRAAGVAGVQRAGGLKEEAVDLLSGDGAMLDATGDDEEFILSEGYGAVAKLHLEGALEDQEHLVFGVVLVPDEFTLELDEFDVLAVQLADDPGSPVVEEEAQFLLQVHLVHGAIVAPGVPKQPEKISAEESPDVRCDDRRDLRLVVADGEDAGDGRSETRCRVKTGPHGGENGCRSKAYNSQNQGIVWTAAVLVLSVLVHSQNKRICTSVRSLGCTLADCEFRFIVVH